MFENLTNRLSGVVKTMRGQARLTEKNTQDMLREVRMALLEADVALPVVREFIANVKEKAMGEAVVNSLTPGQALVGIVSEELTRLMGGDLSDDEQALSLAQQPPAIILMAGLQGAGKTTTVGKLGKLLKEGQLKRRGKTLGKKKVLVVSADVYRPAAIQQLETLAGQVGIDFFPSNPEQKPVDIALAALDHAKRHFYDVLMVDTAGRLGIDEAMMAEIADLHKALNPVETLFVIDAMQGQDAVNVAKAFSDALPLTGVVMTKLDGDARGGAALSVRHITGKPLKFVGVSEKVDGLERFYPERMANRILGMGDILSMVEEAQRTINEDEAKKLAKKMKNSKTFDLHDFKEQLGQFKNMGNMSSMLSKLPAQFGAAANQLKDGQAEKQLARVEAIINSMTPLERSKPDLIKASRKKRIAAGAGVRVQDVNQMLKQFDQMKMVMKQFKKGGMGKMMRMMRGMKGMIPPGMM